MELSGRQHGARKRPHASKPAPAKGEHRHKNTPEQASREQEQDAMAVKTVESGRLRHREHQRSEEAGHEPRRGEVATGQES